MSDTAANLDRAAAEIRAASHAGWGNACEDGATEIRQLRARVAELEAILGRVRNEIRTADLMIAGLDLEIDAVLEGK